MSHRRFLSLLLLVFVAFPLARQARAADPVKSLPPAYRHWIQAEVPYIISTEEQKQFLALTNDAQRDNFIDTFWRIRNPEPGSSVNTYKEEHYRRLAYANETFGDPRNEDGWRTDRGRMYIIMGAPKQRARYNDTGNVRPMEIWFYQSSTPALPPFFYLLFYKQSSSEDYKLYSPRFDGPVQLCSTGETRNDPVMALSIIRKGLGEEVARTAVTFLPNEHVNLSDFEPSMETDELLATISNLPDNPFTKEKLEANRIRERVTTSIFLGDQDATLSYVNFRDDRGRLTLSYLMLLRYPNPRLVGTRADGSKYYDVTLRTDVVTSSGHAVYSQEDRMTGNLNDAQAENARKKRFGAEARLPLEPGNYILQSTLTNNVDQTATRQRTTVSVPQIKSQSISISSLLAYTAPAGVPDPSSQLPFSGSRFRFTPRGAQNVYLRQGEKLPLVFQLWLDPKPAIAAPQSEKVHVHYVFGSIGVGHEEPGREDEEVDAANRDDAGNLLTGHTLDTSSLAPGNYQVAVSAARDGDPKTAYATLSLHIAPAAEYVESWTAYGPTDPGGAAADDVKRGLAAEAQGSVIEAKADYQRALVQQPSDLRSVDLLANVLERLGLFDQLAELSALPILQKESANPATLVMIAHALNKTGNPKSVVRLLEKQITLQPPNIDLYGVLADACMATGNRERANEIQALAARLK